MIKSWNTTTTLSLNWYDGFALVTSTTCRDSIWCRWLLRCESSDESLEIGSYNVLEQVPLLMSVKLVSFKGTLLIKIRPPPSDHIWLCFQAMPHLEIAAEVAIGDHKINNALLGRYIVQYIKVGFHINYLVSLSISSLSWVSNNPNCKKILCCSSKFGSSYNIIEPVHKVRLVVMGAFFLGEVGLIGNTL